MLMDADLWHLLMDSFREKKFNNTFIKNIKNNLLYFFYKKFQKIFHAPKFSN